MFLQQSWVVSALVLRLTVIYEPILLVVQSQKAVMIAVQKDTGEVYQGLYSLLLYRKLMVGG